MSEHQDKVKKAFPSLVKIHDIETPEGAISFMKELNPDFVYDQNGTRYTLRWSMADPPVICVQGQVPERIAQRVSNMVVLGELEIEKPEPKAKPKPKAAPKKKEEEPPKEDEPSE